MKRYRGTLLMSAVLLATLPVFGCGNALEGGSSPSGSYITAEVSQAQDDGSAYEPDIYLSICEVGTDGTITYEPGLVNTYASVTFFNNSAPNTPDGESTNNDVTMSRYRVDYAGLNKSVSVKSFDGAGSTVIVPKDGSASMSVNIMSLETLDYIRDRYPTVGNGESLELRATITIWGEDPFGVTVSPDPVDVTMIIDDYDRCE